MEGIQKAYRALVELARREINYYCIRPTNMLAFLTYRCTSQCKTCRMWQRQDGRRELTLDEWKKIVAMAGEYRIRNIEMFGGDALLRKDVLLPLTAWAKEIGIPAVDFVTNGFLLDRRTAEELIRAGFDKIYLSLDGIGAIHETARGVPGSFDRAKEGLENLIAARAGRNHPRIIVNCTVSAINIRGLKELIPFAARLGVDQVAYEYIGEFPEESVSASRIEGIEPQPYYVPQGASLLLNREQASFLKGALKELHQDALRYNIKVFTKNIDFLTTDELTSGILPNKKCYVCRYLITVDPYGEVLSCPFFNTYSLGSLCDGGLNRIWRNERHKRFIRHVDKKRMGLCKHCILSVERNPTIAQELCQSLLWVIKKGR